MGTAKFVVTHELGRLARWLRILGYDAVIFTGGGKRNLVLCSLKEGRVIITRDSRLSRFSGIRLLHITSDFVEAQLIQALQALGLQPEESALFTRCVLCNQALHRIDKQSVYDKVPPHVFKTNDSFMACKDCNRIYWKGTHWKLAKQFLDKVHNRERS